MDFALLVVIILTPKLKALLKLMRSVTLMITLSMRTHAHLKSAQATVLEFVTNLIPEYAILAVPPTTTAKHRKYAKIILVIQ